MKIDYSYRAFLLTSLIFGCLFLILYSAKLGAGFPVDESSYNVEYTDEITTPEEELAQLTAAEKRNIETNKAFNEAEKFISELETSENQIDETLAALDEAINDSEFVSEEGIRKAREKIRETRETALKKKKKKKRESGSGNRNTTISYDLVNRGGLYIPNPVYTCDRGGIVVIDIQVNALGKVTKTHFNKRASTTQNGCLVESAIMYAEKARFTTAPSIENQKGTITYNFPGQQ